LDLTAFYAQFQSRSHCGIAGGNVNHGGTDPICASVHIETFTLHPVLKAFFSGF
jgi:hypothetical protein